MAHKTGRFWYLLASGWRFAISYTGLNFPGVLYFGRVIAWPFPPGRAI